MKFFKYLILFFICTSSYAEIRWSTTNIISDAKYSGSFTDACKSYLSDYSSKNNLTPPLTMITSTPNTCRGYRNNGSGGQNIDTVLYPHDIKIKCEPGTKSFLDGYITSQTGLPPDEVCYSGCLYKSDGGGTAFDTPNGNLSWGFYAQTTGMECAQDTPKGQDKPVVPDDPNMKPEECKNANGSDAYCDKPKDKNCPTGYKQGMFNNKQICVKNSTDPDPTKPNPNDPNNGDGKGNCNGTNNCNTTNFDDSKIIEAINASTSAISNAIASLSNTITNGLNSLASSINSISSAINANTNAVNANGDKVTNAVNAGTNATKENGKKLDGIKDAIGEGNGFLKDIKDWLTQTPPTGEDAQIPKKELEKKSFNENLLSISAPSCPPDWQFNWVTPFGTIDKKVSYQDLCDSSGWLGYLFLAISYVIGARIVMGDS